MDYYVEKAKKEIESRKEKAELFVKEWQGVERRQTKDGKDFVVMANNFRNKDGEKCIFADHYNANEYRLKVYVHGVKCGYEDDELNITPTVYANTDEAKRYEEEGRLVSRGAYLHPFYNMTCDEIEQAIKDKIEYWQSCIKEHEQALAQFEEITDKLVAMREEAKAFIETLPDKYVFRQVIEGK